MCGGEILEQLWGVRMGSRGEVLLWVMNGIPFDILGDIQAIIRLFKTTCASRTTILHIGKTEPWGSPASE